MTEKIIRALTEIAGISPTLRLNPKGGASLYPEGSELSDGCRTLKIRARFKGENPSAVFGEAERAYSAFSSPSCTEKLKEAGIGVYGTEASLPAMESCDSSGLYTVSFTVSVKFALSGNSQGGDSHGGENPASTFPLPAEYVGGDGSVISFGKLFSLDSAEGTEPYASVSAEENAFFDGAEYISSHVGARRITLSVSVKGTGAEERRRLYKAFRTGNEGTLYFRWGENTRKIRCRTEKITMKAETAAQSFKITLLCVNPYFENEESVSYCLCGSADLWEFDCMELPEENVFEFSSLIDRNSTLTVNNGDVAVGCVIRAEIGAPFVRGIKITHKGTKEFIAVSGSFTAGDVVIFDTRDGSKGISLSRKNNSSYLRDITDRIVWGSEFFRIPVGKGRVHIAADGGLNGISASITFTERFEGV